MTAASTQAENKKLVWNFLQSIKADNYSEILARGFTASAGWQGPHPINKLNGVESIADDFYRPLFSSFPDLRRKDDLFFAGPWNGSDWVTATGHYEGTFTHDWLGIPATGETMRIRYGEFYRVVDGNIADAYVILDLIDVMQRAGIRLIPPCFGDDAPVPGPATKDGILMDDYPAEEGRKTAKLVDEMIVDLMRFDPNIRDYSVMCHDRCWHGDMKWYGPAGIGTTYGIGGFIEHHQRPFLTAFPDRVGGHNHVARPAEGDYVASTGWPSVEATHCAKYLGQPATHRKISMRVMDFWRRDGDKLRENWVLIDLPELFLQMGFDLFGRLKDLRRETEEAAS